MSEEDLVLLSASPNAGAGTVEGRAFKARRIGDQIYGRKKMRILTSEGDIKHNVFMGNNSYKTIRILYNNSRVY
jgi:hypothetical protein